MRILRVIPWAVAALLAMTALARADPISIAILGFLGINAAAGSFLVSALTFLLTAAAQIGLSLLQAALNKPKTPGVNFEVEIGDDSPIGFVTGAYATPGTRKFINAWGKVGKTPNAYLVDVIQYGDLPSYGIPGLWVNGKKATLLTAEPHSEFGYPVQEFRNSNGADFLWIKVKDGTQTEADPYLLARFAAHATMPWVSDMIGIGCPHLIVTVRFNPKKPGGAPQLLIEPPPQRWYNIRKDTTAGGSGAHRWGEPATWEPTVNPIVQIYNIIRGVYFGDEWVFGGQNLSAYRLPASNWMAAMNEADVPTVTFGDEEEPQFRGGLEIRGDMEPLAVIEELLKGSSSRLAEVGGRFKILCGAPGAAVYSFDDGGIVVTREQGFRPFPRLDETVNGIEATYPEPGEMWAQKDAPARYSDDLEAEDAGFRLATGIQFNAVPYGIQVQRLMETMLAEARRFRMHTLYLPPEAYPIEPLDVVSWSSTRNGYSNKKFLVGRVDGEPGMNQLVMLKEIDPADYGGGGDYVPVTPWPPGDFEPPGQAIPSFDAEGYVIVDADDVPRRPSIKVTFDGDLDDVRAVQIQVRLDGETDVIYDYDIPYGEPGADDSIRQLILNGTFLPNEDYEVRGLLVPRSTRAADWTGWIPVTTPNVLFGVDDLDDDLNDFFDWINGQVTITLPDLIGDEIAEEAALRNDQIQAEAAARIADASNLAGRFRFTEDSLRDVALVVAEQDFRNWADKQQLRTEIQVEKADVTAKYLQAITVAIGEGSAIAIQLETLEAEVGSVAAAVSTETSARVIGDLALATQITLLSAGSGDQFDWIKLWFFDSGAEGFTGNGTPSVAAGFIRPADDASDPHIESPTAIGADGVVHRQVRMRIKKTGTPAWEGYLWWRGAADATWDAGRRASFSEPAYSGGYGNVTINPEWTGDIDRIRIDLSSVQDGSNYFEIDWIGVGRPSPGASQAALLTESIARADGDSALAAQITTLTASLNDTNGELAGQGTILSTMQVTVEELEDDLIAVSALVDTIINVTLPGKASVTALSALEAEVAELGGGGVLATGRITSSIRTELEYLGALIAEGQFASDLGNQQSRKLVADAYQILDTSIKQVDGKVDIAASAIAAVQAVLPTKANASAFNGLSVRVSESETGISVLAAAVVGINATVATKASATALTELTARVTTAEGEIDAQAAAITAIEVVLPGKASASALTALTTRVTETEDEIDILSSAVTSINSTLTTRNRTFAQTTAPTATAIGDLWIDTDDQNKIYRASATGSGSWVALPDQDKVKTFAQAAPPTAEHVGDLWIETDDNNEIHRWSGSAWVSLADPRILASASAITTLTTRVTDAEGDITAVADALTALNSEVDGFSASGRFRITTEATNAGAQATIGISVAATGGGATKTAAMFLDALSSGSSRIIMVADKFIVKNDASTVSAIPFAVVGGVVRIQNVVIGTAVIEDGAINSPKTSPLLVGAL